MKRHIGSWLILAYLSLSPAIAKETADHCAARPTILSLANRIIDGREGLKIIRSRRFGTDAAYLLIRYGDLDETATTALLDRITTENLIGAAELRAAYEITNGTYDFDRITQERDFDTVFVSGWRALILRDDGVRFFDLAQTSQSMDGVLPREDLIAVYTRYALADVSDAIRLRVARTAERMDQIPTALTLLAGNADPAPFHALIARHPDHRFLQDRHNLSIIDAASIRAHAAPLTFNMAVKPSPFEWRRRFFEIRRANYQLGSFAFLGTFINITGAELMISDTAEAVNDAIDSGWLDPVKRPEQAWISVYRQLVERMGHARVDAGLTFAREQRGYIKDQTVRDTIHGAIAARALAHTWRHGTSFEMPIYRFPTP